ncbi:MAG: Holliday junction branch migration protein RuvA [Cyclobacteriaceae bacterium]
MITYLEGKLELKEPTHVIIDVNGIGYEVKISLTTFSEVKSLKKVRLHTHFHVKEDAQTLYGFYHASEKKRFQDLIGISGVGPSTALMILSSLSAEELQAAIAHENVKVIQGVKGIGAKTAQRIVLELKDKMKKEGLLDKAIKIPSSPNNRLRSEALSALITLGIGKPAAEKTVDALLNEDQDLTLEELIKLALKRA